VVSIEFDRPPNYTDSGHGGRNSIVLLRRSGNDLMPGSDQCPQQWLPKVDEP
jgi:hypothetical protein